MNTTEKITPARFRDVLDEIQADVDAEYSGRGMCGEQCIGVRLANDRALLTFAADLMCAMPCGDEREAVRGLLARTQFDSMGRALIAYWPEMRTDP